MKHITHILTATVACVLGWAMSSCNDIKEDERFIELPAVEAKRVVLMEEFTGQLCVNCPAAHEVIAGLLAQYPDNLISVSIHGGGDAFSFSEDKLPGVGLRTADGQDYCDGYQINALPSAVVNRGTGALNVDQWAAAIRSALESPTDIEMGLRATLSTDGQSIDIVTDVTPYDNMQGRLQLWVVESGIVSIQLTPSGYDQQYVHNHVFRGVVNGHDGEEVTLTTREPRSYIHTVRLRETWNAERLSIVAFVYTPQGVVQAVEAPVRYPEDTIN